MAKELFDQTLRSRRRNRAFRSGPALFLYERAFDDVLERLTLVRKRFSSALLIGCPNPEWPQRLRSKVANVRVIDPGGEFASAAGGECAAEDRMLLDVAEFDLCIAIGTLDSANDLPRVLANIRNGLSPDALLVGAIAGGDSLPALRTAMHAAGQSLGGATAHVHPRIGASSLAMLLGAAGFVDVVVDVDRVEVSYPSLDKLVGDLRAMGVTNVLLDRSRRSLSKAAFAAAKTRFEEIGLSGRTTEIFEILNFAAWTPAVQQHG